MSEECTGVDKGLLENGCHFEKVSTADSCVVERCYWTEESHFPDTFLKTRCMQILNLLPLNVLSELFSNLVCFWRGTCKIAKALSFSLPILCSQSKTGKKNSNVLLRNAI